MNQEAGSHIFTNTFKNFLDGPSGEENRPYIRQGRLAYPLGEIFLKDYIEKNKTVYPDLDRVPAIVNGILPIIMRHESVADVFLTSSLAKAIAVGAMPEYYWEIYDYFKDQKKRYPSENHLSVQTMLRELSQVHADIDVKISYRNYDEANMHHILHHVARHFNVPDDQIKSEPVNDEGDISESFQISYDDMFDIVFQVGPVPTNLKKHLMRIGILYKTSPDGIEEPKHEVFHIDIGETGLDALSMLGDKRLGETSLKQDMCIARLSNSKDHIYYWLSKDAIPVMKKPDEIRSESSDPSDVMEIALRALRMNLQYPTNGMDLKDFSPEFTSPSLFQLRRNIQHMIIRGDEVKENVKSLIQREMALCLTINPFVTVQFLRDSGIAYFIPGLSQITRHEWNEILRSKYFAVEKTTYGLAPSRAERTWGYMNRQQVPYKNASDGGIHVFNGVERFVRAVHDIHLKNPNSFLANPWEGYYDLWDKRHESPHVFIETPSFAGGLSRPEYVEKTVLFSMGSYEIWGPASYEHLLTTQEVKKQVRDLLNFPNMTFRINEVLRTIVTARAQMETGEMYPFQGDAERLKSVALVYLILKQFPSGLTPREIQSLYTGIDAGFNKKSFEQTFLDIKLLSMTNRQMFSRINQNGLPESLDMYSLLEGAEYRNIGLFYAKNIKKGFIDAYKKILLSAPQSEANLPSDDSLKEEVSNYAYQLKNKGMRTIQAVYSLTSKDLTLLGEDATSTETAVEVLQKIWHHLLETGYETE